MPNLKIYVESDLHDARRQALFVAMAVIRSALMRHMAVPQAACLLAILPVLGLPDQPALAVEMQILPHADRDRACVAALGQEIRAILLEATGAQASFRCMQHDPETYVVIR